MNVEMTGTTTKQLGRKVVGKMHGAINMTTMTDTESSRECRWCVGD